MTKNTFNLNDFNFNELQHELTTKSREVWLASLGALATVQEESTKLYDTLAKTGSEIKDQAVALQRRVMNLPEEAQDLLKEGESYAENLMDKGEELEKDLRKQAQKLEKESTKQFNTFVNELQEKGNEWQKNITKAVSNPFDKVATPVQSGVNSAMHYFGIPSHNEIQVLNHKVEILTEKVEALATLLADKKGANVAEKEAIKASKTAKVAKAEKAVA